MSGPEEEDFAALFEASYQAKRYERSQTIEGEVAVRISHGTFSRHLFYEHSHAGHSRSGLTTVNDRSREGDEQREETASHVLHDFAD